jgi:hypothetical protein
MHVRRWASNKGAKCLIVKSRPTRDSDGPGPATSNLGLAASSQGARKPCSRSHHFLLFDSHNSHIFKRHVIVANLINSSHDFRH